MTKLSILIVTYNTKDLTLECIKSLLENFKDEIEKGEYEILLIDNNSSDSTIEELKKVSKNIVILKNNKNYGFGKGINMGEKKAKGEFLLFLNSDTLFDSRSRLNKMVEFLDSDQRIGVIGGKIIDNNGAQQKSVGNFYKLYHVFIDFQFKPKSLQEVDWVEGSFFMIRRDFFKQLGGFDENFFMYVEDMDLCFRIRKLGYKVYFYPESQIIHVAQGSSNKTFAIISIYKGLFYFYKKHKSSLEYSLLKLLLMIKSVVAIIIGIIFCNRYLIKTYKQALVSTI